MAKIMSYNDAGDVLLWEKNVGPWKDTSLDDTNFDPNEPVKDSYFFNTFFRTGSNKTLFFATDQFHFGIKIIESTDRNNNFKIEIAPINQLLHLPSTPPNLILSANSTMNNHFEVPFGVIAYQPKDVYVTNNYKHDIELVGNFNGTMSQNTINPSTLVKPYINLGVLTNSMSFSVNFTDPKDIAYQCRIRIILDRLQPQLVFIDRKGYSDLRLVHNPTHPGTINITIEPDIP